MYEDLFNKLHSRTALEDNIHSICEGMSWEQIAKAFYQITEGMEEVESFRNTVASILVRKNQLMEDSLRRKLATAAATGLISGAAMLGGLHPRTQKQDPAVSQEEVDQVDQETSLLVDMDKIDSIESSNDPRAVNPRSGARGLTQIMQTTWEEMVRKMGKDWTWDDAFDAEKNKAVGNFCMNVEIPRLLSHYGIPDSIQSRIAAYNWGIGNLRKIYQKYGEEWKDHLPEETIDYLRKYGEDEADSSVNENLTDFAKYELDLAGMFDKDSDYDGMLGEAVMELLELFSSQGHSGYSAALTVDLFDKLASYKPLTELTDNPKEWMLIAEDQGHNNKPLWQSTRSPSCFSEDGGKTYYDIDELEEGQTLDNRKMHTSKHWGEE